METINAKFCSQCGNGLPLNVAFCPICGAKLASHTATSASCADGSVLDKSNEESGNKLQYGKSLDNLKPL